MRGVRFNVQAQVQLEGVPKQQALTVTWALVCIQAQLARSTEPDPKELETIQNYSASCDSPSLVSGN